VEKGKNSPENHEKNSRKEGDTGIIIYNILKCPLANDILL